MNTVRVGFDVHTTWNDARNRKQTTHSRVLVRICLTRSNYKWIRCVRIRWNSKPPSNSSKDVRSHLKETVDDAVTIYTVYPRDDNGTTTGLAPLISSEMDAQNDGNPVAQYDTWDVHPELVESVCLRRR